MRVGFGEIWRLVGVEVRLVKLDFAGEDAWSSLSCFSPK